MSLLGLELSDAGILVAAAGATGLIQVDGVHRESPGFALADGNRLLVGRDAEGKAHLHPRQVNTAFWDQLNTEPLPQPCSYAQNHAEIACAHLSRIWANVEQYGEELAIAVPGFYDREQLGLILGMARELSISIKGFVPQPLASSATVRPERTLLHLDIQLHRSEITLLEQGDRLTQKESLTSVGKGLSYLYGEWGQTIADEFVRSTRFDPFHQAVSEQEVYDRLPVVLEDFQQNPSVIFEMAAGPKIHRVTLSRDSFVQKSDVVFQEIRRLVADVLAHHGRSNSPITLQLAHRITRLPGWREMLTVMPDTEIIELQPGASAFGVLNLQDELGAQPAGRGALFVTTRPWHRSRPRSATPDDAIPFIHHDRQRPTHVLYRNLAYPISSRPLTIGRETGPNQPEVLIRGEVTGVSRKHCSIQTRGEEVVLVDHSTYGTFVDGIRVADTVILQLGQIIRVGTPGEELQLIACVKTDET
ncbi:MAG: FHA domain-containing protein [Deltaproteobacteria bacterium]|nr:MAG: FHA domain-containing protein [Deltaproteobacteria bacterium]